MHSNDHDATESLERARSIQRQTGRTFYLATRLLPERVRHATYVLYAFFRVADDVVDDPDPAPASEQRAELRRLRRGALTGATEDPVLSAVAELRDRYDIPDREIETFLDAMLEDIDPGGYDTLDDLSTYLRGSSVAVAYMMLSVMGAEMSETAVERARPHAKALGEALQLTNFLRDVREDLTQYDRIYLPRSVLEANGTSEDQLRNLEFTPAVGAAIRSELERTERRYRHGVEGIRYLPEDCRFAVLLSATLYAEHHRLIRRAGYDVLSTRPTLSVPRRLLVLARTWWHWRRTGDPGRTFAAVAPLGGHLDGPRAESGPGGSEAGSEAGSAAPGRAIHPAVEDTGPACSRGRFAGFLDRLRRLHGRSPR